MADVYRITQVNIRGANANEACFGSWIAGAAPNATVVKIVADPQNNGGADDRNWYLWRQSTQVTFATCKPDPGVMTSAGKNGWATESEAQSVLDGFLSGSAALGAQVAKQNAAAVSPANIAAGVAKDLVGAGPSTAPPYLKWIAEGFLTVGIAWGAVQLLQSGVLKGRKGRK